MAGTDDIGWHRFYSCSRDDLKKTVMPIGMVGMVIGLIYRSVAP